MQHLITKAAPTATDKGEFTAIAAAYNVDRVGDRIAPGAFAKTLAAWQDRGTPIPLHWNHSARPEDIIGEIDPSNIRETEKGLYVEGQLDLEGSDVARAAWKAMKRGAIYLSFGYMTTASREEGEVKVLEEIDLFEVTLTPHPANPDTRVLSMKSAPQRRSPFHDAEAKALEEIVNREPATKAKPKVEAKSHHPIKVATFEA